MFKVQSYTMWAVHVHVLWPVLRPHNFIPNVVVSVTIHDDKYLHICETFVEGQTDV